MKTNGWNHLAIVVLVGMLNVATMARAQYSPTPQPPSSNDDSAAQARAAKSAALRTLLANFSLTPLQKAQINDALKAQSAKIRALQTDASVTDANRMDKIRAIMDETDVTLKKVFSTEQFQKWQEATKDLRPPGTATGTNAAVKVKE